jgi:hypothetical protein
MKTPLLFALVLCSPFLLFGEVKITVAHRNSSEATRSFDFKNIPAPSKNDAATAAKFTLVDGARDQNGGELDVLHDGRMPREEDQPNANFFFRQNSDGGRIQIDLGSATTIKEVNTYSWHGDARAPQVYKLYASTGKGDAFKAEPKRDTDPETSGWKLLANVDTRPKDGAMGGQYGVSVSDSSGTLGKYRYLLLDVRKTEDKDPFGNTFFSEIDVVDPSVAPIAAVTTDTNRIAKSFETPDGKYRFTIDATVAPELMEWSEKELKPVCIEWYPKLVAMLPSDGYQAPTNITLRYRDDMGGTPASAGGAGINLNAGWFSRNLKGEARGSVVHEMAHVVQSYGRARRTNPNATRTPGWITEGIPDYIRWFLYEPQTRGAEITARNLERAKFDASYRVTGNFLNWVTTKYDTNIVRKLNAAAREGKYSEEIWKNSTGKTVQELGHEWRKFHEERLAAKAAEAAPAAKPN